MPGLGGSGAWSALAGLAVGCILLDLAVQGALISHQHGVYAPPRSRARINTLFMGGMFLGGASGSALAMAAWRMDGWTASAPWAWSSRVAALVQLTATSR
jgi:hypothetical protein